MISLVVFTCLVASCFAQWGSSQGNYQQQPQHQGGGAAPAPVHYVSIGSQLQGDYKFGYNTGNDGSFREETRNPDGSVSGAYGYLDGSGKQKIIRYTAGKDGFKAEGDDIPKAPPAPQPAAPQQAYQPQHYQPQPQQHYQPQQQYQPQNYNNYVQPQQSQAYNQYASPQQQGSYNPFAYHNPAPGQSNANPMSQLSYNIGGGQQNQYQG